jgi:hypothetical protein
MTDITMTQEQFDLMQERSRRLESLARDLAKLVGSMLEMAMEDNPSLGELEHVVEGRKMLADVAKYLGDTGK